jgi:hypothetical protein
LHGKPDAGKPHVRFDEGCGGNLHAYSTGKKYSEKAIKRVRNTSLREGPGLNMWKRKILTSSSLK